MAEIRWTLQAAEDLESITAFLTQSSPQYASLFAINVLAAVERIAAFPQIGRVVPERNDPSIREVILGSYRVIYRLRQEMAELVAIHHGARMLDPERLQ